MKAFHFRLEQALRWRNSQVAVEKSRVAAAAGRVAAIRTQLDVRRTELQNGAMQLSAGSTGSVLDAWPAYAKRSAREIGDLAKRGLEAERELGAAMSLLMQANQKVRLLENLKETARTRWDQELDRELEAFASEAFLVRQQLVRLQSNSGRARSSGG